MSICYVCTLQMVGMVAVCTQCEALQTGFRTFAQRAAHKTRGGAQQRWGQKYLKNRKKSNAYFGKSLVRLACNQEKNKEKSDRKMKTKQK